MIRKIFILVLTICFLFLYTWQQVQILRIGYEISDSDKKLQDLRQVNMELLIKNARLKSPRRIESISREKLGLVASQKSKVITLNPSQIFSPKTQDLRAQAPHQMTPKKTERHFIARFLESLFWGGSREVEAEIVIR